MKAGKFVVLVVEDDPKLLASLTEYLTKKKYLVRGASDGQQALDLYFSDNHEIDLVLLDIMLPGEDGISILKRLRANAATSGLPVIMLTAKNKEYDRVEGLDAGADDFISKPFGIMELVARIRAVLRRAEHSPETTVYQFGSLQIRPERHEVLVDGTPVALTYKEYMLLQLLMENRGLVLTREVLLDRIWGLGSERENRTLDVHIRTLRAKLGMAGSYIQTVRGVGYQIAEESP